MSIEQTAKQRRTFKTGGVSVCFHCQRQLVRIKGGFKFALVRDPIGNETRVHLDCVKQVVGDGYTEVVSSK